jgi:hypothetical protein
MTIYFNSQHLPSAQLEYVSWIDIMGVGAAMSRSVDAVANYIFKLHSAAASCHKTGITLYPVMDGVYVSTSDQTMMLDFVKDLFEECADEFLAVPQSRPLHRFIVRAAIAFGPVIHGNSVPSQAFHNAQSQNPFAAHANYQNSIILGPPMVQAHLSEQFAPPFGVYIHESARTFAPTGANPIHCAWWRWASKTDQRWRDLRSRLKTHYKWCQNNSEDIAYPVERIKEHTEWLGKYMD